MLVSADNSAKPRLVDVASARRLAAERRMDLVEVAPDSNPPVCKIMDYGKFKYEQSKKERAIRRRNALSAQVREVRMTPFISENDLSSKVRLIRKFLAAQGAKVKISVFFRGRAAMRPEFGGLVLKRIWEEIRDTARVDAKPSREGRMVSMIVSGVAPAPNGAPVKPQPEGATETELNGATTPNA